PLGCPSRPGEPGRRFDALPPGPAKPLQVSRFEPAPGLARNVGLLPVYAGMIKPVARHLQSRTGRAGTPIRRSVLRPLPPGTPGRKPSLPFSVWHPKPRKTQAFAPSTRNTVEGSIFTPGPMVEESEIFWTNDPLAPAGFAFCTASANARTFSTSLSSGNEALPTPAWTMPAFSTRNSTEPPLA